MGKENSFKSIAGKALYVFACLVWAALLLVAVGVLIKTYKIETINHGRIEMHLYLAIGFAAFFVSFIIPRVRQNVHWMMDFTHEFTHLLFAIQNYI